MSQQEREIYALLDPDAAVFATCGTDSIVESQEDIWKILN